MTTEVSSSFPVRHEVYGKTTEKFVPSWERAHTQHDKKYDLKTLFSDTNGQK